MRLPTLPLLEGVLLGSEPLDSPSQPYSQPYSQPHSRPGGGAEGGQGGGSHPHPTAHAPDPNTASAASSIGAAVGTDNVPRGREPTRQPSGPVGGVQGTGSTRQPVPISPAASSQPERQPSQPAAATAKAAAPPWAALPALAAGVPATAAAAHGVGRLTAAREDPPVAMAADGWQDWRLRAAGWWSWQRWVRQWTPRSWWIVVPATTPVTTEATAASDGRPQSPAASGQQPAAPRGPAGRAGYEQAAVAEAAAQAEGVVEAGLDFVVRHVLGALGSHGIRELDLDHLDL